MDDKRYVQLTGYVKSEDKRKLKALLAEMGMTYSRVLQRWVSDLLKGKIGDERIK